MGWRKRLIASEGFNKLVAAFFGLWLRFVWVTSRKDLDGWREVAQLIDRHGSIIVVCWHQRTLLVPWAFDLSHAPFVSLTSTGRAGRLAGWIHRHFGMESIPLPKTISGAAEMRKVLGLLTEGTSIGISPDGSRGPARIAKLAPIQWARSTRAPIVVFAFAGSRIWSWPTWDRMHFPLPFGRLALVWRYWDQEIPARIAGENAEMLAAELGRFMDEVTAEADSRIERQ